MDSITSDQRRQYNRLTTDAARKALTAVNPSKEGLQQLFAHGDKWQEYLIAGIHRFTAKAPNYDLAKSILGSDFISPEDVNTARGLTYTDEQLAKFGDTLPEKALLEWCRDNGMMLVAGPPKSMSLLDVRSVKADYLYSKEDGWYAEKAEKFAKNEKAEAVWIALRKEPVEGSLSKNWAEQSYLVEGPMEVPNAAEAVWCLTTYKAVRGTYLLPNFYVRTSSVDSDGTRVLVGNFDAGGLGVNGSWDDGRYSDFGISACWKF